MRVFRWVIRAVVFLLLLSFSLRNTHVVMIDLFPGFRYHQPLVVLLLVAFAFGVLATMVAFLPRWIRSGSIKSLPLPSASSSTIPTTPNTKSNVAS